MARGRRPNLSLEPSRQLLTQRAFRERKAAHLKNLEESVKRLEMQNNALQRALSARGGAADAAHIASMDPSSAEGSSSDNKSPVNNTTGSDDGEEEKSSKMTQWLGNIHHADGAPLLRHSKEGQQQQQPQAGPCASCVATKRSHDEIHAAVASVDWHFATFANAMTQLRSILPAPSTDADGDSSTGTCDAGPADREAALFAHAQQHASASLRPMPNQHAPNSDYHALDRRQSVVPGTPASLISPAGPQRAQPYGASAYAVHAAPSPASTTASGSRPQLSLTTLSSAREHVHPYARPRSSSGQPMGRATALLASMRGNGVESPQEGSYAHARSGSINSASSPYTPMLAAPTLPLNAMLSPGAQQQPQSPWGFAPPASPARRASTAPGAPMGAAPEFSSNVYSNNTASKPSAGCCGVPISESPCHEGPSNRMQPPRPASSAGSGHGMLPPMQQEQPQQQRQQQAAPQEQQQQQQQPFAQPTVHGELGMSTQPQSEECCFGMFKCDSDGRLLL